MQASSPANEPIDDQDDRNAGKARETKGPGTGRALAEALRLEFESSQEEAQKSFSEGIGVGDACSLPLLHINCIEAARGKLLDPASTSGLSSLFKVFADPTRLRLLSALSASELCVCDLGALLGMSQSAVSHQLALLRAARVVRSRREGKVVWYSLDDDHVASLLAMGLEHLGEAGRQS